MVDAPARPALPVIIDPVIGEYDTGIYVDPRMTQAYLHALLPHAQGMTPSGFELEQPTGHRVETVDQVIAAARVNGDLKRIQF